MKTIIRSVLLFVVCSGLWATPRFALMEEINCGGCHFFEGGGAARNSYGDEYGRESLVLKDLSFPWMKTDDESSFSIGFDTRYQTIANEDEDLRHFPMQLALYAGAEYENFILHAEVNRLLDDFQITGGIRYEGLPFESWISAGRELPVMGWRVDDHIIFSWFAKCSVKQIDWLIATISQKDIFSRNTFYLSYG